MQRIEITGIIMPHNWSADGKVTQVAIYTDKEEVYLVEHNRQANELLKYINRRARVKGKKTERLDGKQYIGVQYFIILEEEIATVETGPAPGDPRPNRHCR